MRVCLCRAPLVCVFVCVCGLLMPVERQWAADSCQSGTERHYVSVYQEVWRGIFLSGLDVDVFGGWIAHVSHSLCVCVGDRSQLGESELSCSCSSRPFFSLLSSHPSSSEASDKVFFLQREPRTTVQL